jgi:hypothetical protein
VQEIYMRIWRLWILFYFWGGQIFTLWGHKKTQCQLKTRAFFSFLFLGEGEENRKSRHIFYMNQSHILPYLINEFRQKSKKNLLSCLTSDLEPNVAHSSWGWLPVHLLDKLEKQKTLILKYNTTPRKGILQKNQR